MQPIDRKITASGLLGEKIQDAQKSIQLVIEELGKRIIGQKAMIEGLLIGLFTQGHVLLEGVPGLAKTLVIKSLAEVIRAGFKRIQFTPDLLPADLVGTIIYRPQTGEFVPRKGPLFSNIILADEVNRAPAKVQSAMLEAMEERQITLGETSYALPSPFFVLATQNPIEHEGTYPLPEAELDRFMLKLFVNYPSKEEELKILSQMGYVSRTPALRQLFNCDDIEGLQSLVAEITIDERIAQYIVLLVTMTRPSQNRMATYARLIEYGASPRATIALGRCSRARAMLDGRSYVLPEDVKSVAKDVLRHRISLSYEADSEELTADAVLDRLLSYVAVP